MGERLNHLEEIDICSLTLVHPELRVSVISGSKGSNGAGSLSDTDITTVMEPEDPSKVDIEAIISLAGQLRAFSFKTAMNSSVVPVVISTIRLEEAQIAQAELLNPNRQILPLHWLHYPSVEFASANEPEKLFLGLLSGKQIFGDKKQVIEDFQKARQSLHPELAGLDWITDSLRVFLANFNGGEFPISLQSDSFLKRLATHNLEYFWKWNVIFPMILRATGATPVDWSEAEKFSGDLPKNIWEISQRVRSVRHQGDWANKDNIISLHRETFFLWPII